MNNNEWKSFVEELDWTINLKHSTTYSRQMEDFSEEILLDVKKTVGEFCDASAACLAPEKVEACVFVKSNLGLLRDMGFQNKWEVNVWLIDWFLLASLTGKSMYCSEVHGGAGPGFRPASAHYIAEQV